MAKITVCDPCLRDDNKVETQVVEIIPAQALPMTGRQLGEAALCEMHLAELTSLLPFTTRKTAKPETLNNGKRSVRRPPRLDTVPFDQVIAREAAEILGIGTKAWTYFAKTNGLNPAGRYHNSFTYLRADVEALRSKRVDSSR